MARAKDFGGFLGEAFDLIAENMQSVLLYIAVIGGLNAVGLILGYVDANERIAGFAYDIDLEGPTGITPGLYQLGIVVISIVGSYLLASKLVESRGRLQPGGTRIWAYFFMVLLSALGIGFGLVLLIVPGLILLVRWSAATGFLVGSRKGIIESLGASWEATRGHSWPIFFAGLVLFIILIILTGVVVGGLAFTGVEWLVATLSAFFDAAANAVSLAFGIGVFMLVHDDSEQIGEVFS